MQNSETEMNVKLKNAYNECLEEMKKIGLDFEDRNKIGEITIGVKKRTHSKYGMVRHSNPDKSTKYFDKGKYKFAKYNLHEITISDWVFELDNEVLKNTIIHELVHCFPGCANHGEGFKKVAMYIGSRTKYDIKRTGNIEEDFKKSNKEYVPNQKKESYKYKLTCLNCNTESFRKRFNKKDIGYYKCSYCNGKLKVEDI